MLCGAGKCPAFLWVFGDSSDYERGDNGGFQEGKSDEMGAEDTWD